MSIKGNALAQYLGSGDPALKDYFPEWVKNMADDATVEGSMLDGVVVGGEEVRSIVLTIKSLYDRQEFKSVGPYGDNGWIEDYVAEVHGEPLGCVVLVERNDAPARLSTSWRAIGRAARWCTSPACWPRSSPAPPLASTSLTASPETG